MESLLYFISEYGPLSYGLLFAYCALKSGALPLFAGIAAHYGALELSAVALFVFAGGYLGDEARFYLVRRYGTGFADNRPKIRKALDTAKRLLERYGYAYIFLYRYPKGMRTVGALPVALTAISWRSFTLINAASAVLWTIVMVGLGYVFGSTIEHAISQNWGGFSIALLVIFLAVSYIAWLKVINQTTKKDSLIEERP
ncbi:DedA family protein [Aliikangiella marina]|uniref:DedA family protein n=1 Tax=Aliikangiella marina TaxID=1712262 RepID=A0A545T4D9_9GAMM|nr:DedA family protein [Aliikangiella marina]TQV72093.1 DedA family protein [Aliikangiella marina]